MEINKKYCNNSYLIYRSIVDREKSFSKDIEPNFYDMPYRVPVKNVDDTVKEIEKTIDSLFSEKTKKVALMLSGGIDSAILAAMVPKGTKAYTFQPDVEGANDEVRYAKIYAEINELEHSVISYDWTDFDNSMDKLMLQEGAPVHSIEPQIFKAADVARKEGYTTLLFGEAADAVFGGLDGLLSKDFNLAEFYERFMFVDPSKVLKEPMEIKEPIIPFMNGNNIVDVHGFLNTVFFSESNNSYYNACKLADIEFISPFNRMILDVPLDLERVRSGESKYILREIFKQKYPNLQIRKKLPMPRPVDQWFEKWEGPVRTEFRKDIPLNDMKGDQKWMIYCLERFLNLIEDTNEK